MELTGRQQEIWTFLVDYVDRIGYPPTVREIGEAVGLASPSTVHAHLANLERAGLLARDPSKPRALELTGTGALRRIGRRAAAAAAPRADRRRRAAARRRERRGRASRSPRTSRGDFLLRVKGDSMIEAGILDGDIVVVRRAQDARNGDIVVALVGDDESADEATVKTFYRENGRIRLQPENAALEPIYAAHVQILGKVVGVFRELADGCRASRTGRSTRSWSPCCAARRSSARCAASSCCTTGRPSAAPSARCGFTAGPTRPESR